MLVEKNENLIKKTTALDKENRRLKLAFNQSMVEKADLKKELDAQSGALNDVLKQNTTLNDELKVKSELVKVLREKTTQGNEENVKASEERSIPIPNAEKHGDKTSDINEEDDRVKCNECDFKTRVRTYMKSHKMAHEGQYQCQRGCKEKFKTFSILEEHHENKHTSNKKHLN